MRAFICSMLICISLMAIVILFDLFLLKLLMPKKKCDYFVCIPCDENTKNLRQIAYSVRLKLNLCGECDNNVLVIVDNGICKEELKDVAELVADADGITIVKKEDLKDFINGRF